MAFLRRSQIAYPPRPASDLDRIEQWSRVQESDERVMIDAGPLRVPEAQLMYAIRALARETLALRARVAELESQRQ